MTERTVRLLALGGLVAIAGCARAGVPLPEPAFVAAPDPATVESVFFLVGDAGDAEPGFAPILERLEDDIEWWSERLAPDAAVSVLFLGDIVYPLGMTAAGAESFERDSAVVAGQAGLVGGPSALARGAGAYFMAGNHDWGLEEDWGGFQRLRNLADFLNRTSARTGVNAHVVPEPGTGGPEVVDFGRHARLLMLDTAWWILDGGQLGLDDQPHVLAGIRDAIAGAGDRHVFIAAHHPFRSAGPHGGEFDFWRTLGVRYILMRSGALLQDISSVPYRELENGLRSIFLAEGRPLAFIGGHEHSLQLFTAVDPSDPHFSLVSGSASKLSGVGAQEGMIFGQEAPGYMRLIVERDGAVSLFIEATEPEFLACAGDEAERAACVEEGVAAFRVVHSQRLAPR